MTSVRHLWGWVASLLVAGMSHALAEYRFDIWTADSGLPQNTVRAILQSRDGYLWVATLDGLARFDGVRFTVFNKDSGLPDNHVLSLYEDTHGALWIGMQDGGLARYDHGSFSLFGARDGLTAPTVRTISGDALGNVWVIINNVPVQWNNGRFVPGFPPSASFLAHESIPGQRPGLLWATNQAGLHLFSRGQLTTLNLSNGLPTLLINQADEDQYGNCWLATENGLVKVREGKVVKVYTQREGLPRNAIQTTTGSTSPAIACEDRKGNLWINGAGPWLGRLKDGIFTAYPSADTLSSQPLPAASGLPGSFINSLFEDHEGNLWICTEGSGLIRARPQAVETLSARHGLAAVNVYPICEDRAGAIWLGTWETGLARFKDGMVTNFAVPSPHGDLTALCEDRAGRLWLGTIGGVTVFKNGVTSQNEVPPALRSNIVHAIYQDRSGALWFGAEIGLFHLDKDNLTFFSKRDGLAPASLTVLIEDRAGSLWIGGRGGLTRLAKGQFTTWTERDGLPAKFVTTIYQDSDDTLWIGSGDGGLGRLKNGRFTRFTKRDGLFDDGVFQILEDSTGNFWMSSNRGIQRVSKQELNEFAEGRRRTITAVAYRKSDGMLNAECNGGCWPAGIKARDGKLWFPTQDGVAVIDPAALSANLRPPQVQIEAFLVDREPQSLQHPVRVRPGKPHIEIQYTGLSLVNSERLRFKYRLVGADDQWLEAGTRRMAYYSQLAPGHYVFQVLAANSDGVWNETGASLAFVALPAWYQTWWCRSGAGVLIVGLAGFAYRRRVARLERERAAEQEFSRRLMQSQELERQRLAAELHDSVGQNLLVIKNRALMALEHSTDPGRMSEQITEVSTMASHALREVRSMAQDLRPFQLDEMGLSKAILAITRRLADSFRIQFHTDIAELNGELPKEHEIHFYRVVQELLTNIVKHSRATEANLTIRKAGPIIRALIQDNGCGFDPGQPSSESPQGGFGLRGIRERMRTIGGRLQFDSRAGEGTTVVLEVPIERSNETPD